MSVLFLLPVAAIADEPPAAAKDGLKVGDNLPGSFLPYNATGAYKGRFHCLVSDHGLEPAIMLILRDFDPSDSVKDLLKQIDDRIEKNPAARLHAFAVFLTDDRTDVLTNDDKRDQLARRLEDLANGLMLKNVVLGLDSPKDVAKYALNETRGLVVLYNKYRIAAIYQVGADGNVDTAKIMAEVGEKLKASKTK
jgi:hypothetical protein